MPSRMMTVKDLQVNVSITGQGPPLLLLNGLGGLIKTFDALRNELGDYTTITLDVPGVGKSQMPRWPMRLPSHADLIAEMLKQLGFDHVDVFGVSWGGALAQELALRHPTMVRRLILAATSAGPVLLVKPADILEFFRGNAGGKQPERDGSASSTQALLRFGVVKRMLTVRLRTYHHQLAALVGWTSLLRLFRLHSRTLILIGDRDTLVQPYNAHILRRSIPQAELRVLKGEGHFFVVTSARRTAVLIREFLCRQQNGDGPAPEIANRAAKQRLQRANAV
ncbi:MULTISPECIES: alpha/beta fold hydrolase [Pseudomonas]|uniref:alpha/beta fold hydrolase n=1 Tax=Pseudomonas TaxID=286 RepID=UPI000F79DBB3|nr:MULTISPECIES: alpha/beta fold hydrolase [Pseudomonas]RRW54602.1 alpha/beta fold hydrolase [Pseudomonas moraviensis]